MVRVLMPDAKATFSPMGRGSTRQIDGDSMHVLEVRLSQRDRNRNGGAAHCVHDCCAHVPLSLPRGRILRFRQMLRSCMLQLASMHDIRN
jgi:hypothetical protein